MAHLQARLLHASFYKKIEDRKTRQARATAASAAAPSGSLRIQSLGMIRCFTRAKSRYYAHWALGRPAKRYYADLEQRPIRVLRRRRGCAQNLGSRLFQRASSYDGRPWRRPLGKNEGDIVPNLEGVWIDPTLVEVEQKELLDNSETVTDAMPLCSTESMRSALHRPGQPQM